jgi:hypothetical protein
MRSNRFFLLLIVAALTLLAVPAVADCGAPHGAAAEATEAKACCGGAADGKTCGADCPHAGEAMKLAAAAEKGDAEAMTKLVALVKESGHGDMTALADKAAGGCEASQASLIAMVKSHAGDDSAMPAASIKELAKAAGSGCAKSTEMLIANAKKSDNTKMADLAKRAEGGCSHSRDALIAMASETPADGSK